MSPTVSSRRRARTIVLIIRWGVPAFLVILGIVSIFMGHGHIADVSGDIPNTDSGSQVFTSIPTDRNSMYSAVGVALIIVAFMFMLLSFLLRFNAGDEADRQREEAAREYFSRTGRWPGEQGPSRT